MSWGALVSVILWGASFVALKMALNELSPLQLILMRTLLGALALDTVLLWRGQWRRATQLTRRDWTRIGLLVIISVFAHQLVQLVGLRQTTAINGALLITLAPLFMFVLSMAFFGERLTWIKATGFLTAILGSMLVITRGDLRALSVSSETLTGDWLIVVSALGWALYSTLSKDMLRKQSPLLVVALVFSLSVPLLAALTLPGAKSFVLALGGLSWHGWVAVLFLAWGSSALAYGLWYASLQKHDMSQVSIYQYLQPLVATLLGVVVLRESVVWATVVGGLTILSGVTLVNRPWGGKPSHKLSTPRPHKKLLP